MKILQSPIAKIFLLAFLLLSSSITLEAQLVREEFNQPTFIEDFQSHSGRWPNVNNAENLLVIQKGAYYVERTNNKTSFSILPDLSNDMTSFRLLASFSVEQCLREESGLGLLFMIQPNGKGGFSIEINNKREFRIRQLKNGSFNNISGDLKSGGWVKSNALIPGEAYNTIEVRTHLKNYDVYLNNDFTFSFNELTYKSGGMGVLLGPGTKGKLKSYEVYTLNRISDPLIIGTKPEDGNSTASDSEKQILTLKKQIKTLTTENEKLKSELGRKSLSLESGKSSDILKAMKILEDQLSISNLKIDSLERAGQKCKELFDINGGEDSKKLILQISELLKNETMISESLRRKNADLNLQLKAILLENEKLRKK